PSRTMRTIRPIWLHPTDRSQGLILGTDKHADGALSLPASWRWRFPALWAKLSSQEAPMKVPLALLFLFGLRLGFRYGLAGAGVVITDPVPRAAGRRGR